MGIGHNLNDITTPSGVGRFTQLVPHSRRLPYEAWSVCGWYTPTLLETSNYSSWLMVRDVENDLNTDYANIYYNNTDNQFGVFTVTGGNFRTPINTPKDLANGDMVFQCLIWNGDGTADMGVWVDGTSTSMDWASDTGLANTPISNRLLIILSGYGAEGTTYCMAAQISHVKFWERALTRAEMDIERQCAYPRQTRELCGYWPLETLADTQNRVPALYGSHENSLFNDRPGLNDRASVARYYERRLTMYWGCEHAPASGNPTIANPSWSEGDTTGTLVNSADFTSTSKVGTYALTAPASVAGGCTFSPTSMLGCTLSNPVDMDFSVGFWFQMPTGIVTVAGDFGFRCEGTSASDHVAIKTVGGTYDGLEISVSDATNGAYTVGTGTWTPSSDTWYFCLGRVDIPGNRLRIEVWNTSGTLVASGETTGAGNFSGQDLDYYAPAEVQQEFTLGLKSASHTNAVYFDNFMMSADYDTKHQDYYNITDWDDHREGHFHEISDLRWLYSDPTKHKILPGPHYAPYVAKKWFTHRPLTTPTITSVGGDDALAIGEVGATIVGVNFGT